MVSIRISGESHDLDDVWSIGASVELLCEMKTGAGEVTAVSSSKFPSREVALSFSNP